MRSNRSDGYKPIRFVQKTRSGNAPTNELIDYLSRLVLQESALGKVELSLHDHPNLLTIEDFLQYQDWSEAWGFTQEVTVRAMKLVNHYDIYVGFQRWQW